MAKRNKRPPAATPSRPELEGAVPHPRHGSDVIPSGCSFTEAEIRSSFYGYHGKTIYPESAIPADLKRQNFSTFARVYYVDILEVCRTCERSFLFFAREQQYWYEDLGFYVDTDCVYCPSCRRKRHEVRDSLKRYSANVGRDDLEDAELAALVEDAVLLWKAGAMRSEQRLRWLRNCARRRLPRHRATVSIERLVAELEKPAPG